MAIKNFIFQGVTPNTHIDAVRMLFDVSGIKKVFLSVAFVVESGVSKISDLLKKHKENVFVLAGIRNDITSYQGLLKLLEVSNDLYVVDTGTRSVIFHPKIYLVQGEKHSEIVLGSANLTLGGMNNNIEAGVYISFDMENESDRTSVNDLIATMEGLPGEYKDNIIKISNVEELKLLLNNGIIADERIATAPKASGSSSRIGGADKTPRMKLKVAPLRNPSKKVQPPKAKAKPSSTPGSTETKTVPAFPTPPKNGYEFVWESKELERRDLTIPDQPGTHPTGSINLDKGKLDAEIDHRHYFRDVVFKHLKWQDSKNPGIVETVARAVLVIKGVSHGEHWITLRHTTSTTSASYKQRNAMTRLSWGTMKEHIAHEDLIGRTLSIYRDNSDNTKFILEID